MDWTSIGVEHGLQFDILAFSKILAAYLLVKGTNLLMIVEQKPPISNVDDLDQS